MELEVERYLRTLARKDDLYYTNPARVKELTDDLILKDETIFQFIFMGDSNLSHCTALANWWIPVRSPCKVLDIGSGVGTCSVLLSRITNTNFTQFNIDQHQLDLALDIGPKVQGDMNEGLPFPDESFDEVVMLYSLGHAKLDHIMPEIYRVLTKKAGLFIYDIYFEKQIEAAMRFNYVAYNPYRVIEEAESAGFYNVRVGIPMGAIYRDITQTLPISQFSFYNPKPMIYRFAKESERASDELFS